MSAKPNPDILGDPLAKGFETWLVAERSVTENTRLGYISDLAQFASATWGEGAKPPFAWAAVQDSDARRYLAQAPRRCSASSRPYAPSSAISSGAAP